MISNDSDILLEPILEKVTNFILDHGDIKASPSILKEQVRKYFDLGNYVCILDCFGDVMAIACFSIIGNTAIIHEVIIHPECRRRYNRSMIRYLVAQGWHKFPYLTTLKYERKRKHPDRKPIEVRMSYIFGR